MKKNLSASLKHLFLPFLSASLLLAGCGAGGSRSDSYKSEAVAETATETTAAAVSMNSAAQSGYDGGYGQNYDMEYEGGVTEEIAEDSSAALTDPNGIKPAAVPGRKLIRNVYMNVETDTFDDLLTQLQSKVTELAGYVEQSDISGASITYDNVRPNRYASMTARIPVNKLDQFIAVVEGNSNVTNKSESVQDITLKYSDLESRKKTLTVEQDRIWALLEKADTLEAVIALESRLSEIRYELESMESQLRLFDNQVEYSTISISIHEVMPADFTPVAPETVGQRIQKGFVKNLNGLFTMITDLFILLIAGSPVWVPLAVIVIAAVMIARKAEKKRRAALQQAAQATPVGPFWSEPPVQSGTAASSGTNNGSPKEKETGKTE